MTDLLPFLIEGSEKEIIEKTVENEIQDFENRKYDLIIKTLEIVDKYKFDPWNIDLSKFADIFMKEINESFKDFPVAGKIIYLAWINLKSKSEMLIPKELPEPEDITDNYIEDVHYTNEFVGEITLPYVPSDKRNVSIHDLIDAIKKVKILPRRKPKKEETVIPIGEYSHPEDLHLIIRTIWNRILDMENETFPMETIFGLDLEDKLDVFVSSLYLSYYNKILLAQEVPYGTIWITVIDRSHSESPLPEMKLDEPFII